MRTRLGFGAGLSYAQRIPYLDPSVDVNLGDLLRARSLRETYFGFGASHRSGIFGTSQLLGNVNGGSNYIYSYVETSF